jgi:DNA-binding IclR family transcriptional regulator
MEFSERKFRTLDLFAQHGPLRPDEVAQLTQFIPSRACWSYLKRLWRHGLLRRRRDWNGRYRYTLGRAGARWLLWKRQQMKAGIHG